MSLYGILPPVSSSSSASASSVAAVSSSLQQQQQQQQQQPQQLPAGWSSSLSLQPLPIRRQPTTKKPPRPTTTAFSTTEETPKHLHGFAFTETTSNNVHLPPSTSTSKHLTPKPPFIPVKHVHRQQHEKKRAGKGQRDVLSMTEEYDPARPNDYEEYKEAKKRRKEEEAVHAQLQQQQKQHKQYHRKDNFKPNAHRSSSPSRYDARENSPPYRSRSPSPVSHSHSHGGLGFNAPVVERNPIPTAPRVNLAAATGEDAYLMRGRLSSNVAPVPVAPPITTPPLRINQPFQPSLNERTTRVVLLTNMVGPGEVDNTLQEETAEECSKYGKVEKCLIFEVPNGQVPPDQSVRIFVQFANATFAQSAVTDLNGRFFGGRVVTARFFDEGKFARLELAPVRNEGR